MERIELHKRVSSLLRHHHLLSIATVNNGKPWCASCFYAFDADQVTLIITTDPETRHGKEFSINPEVAGTIALETKRVGRIRGIQFTGTVSVPEGAALDNARKLYLRRFPYAILADLHLWTITLNHIKLTDNRMGFGKKIVWNRVQEVKSK